MRFPTAVLIAVLIAGASPVAAQDGGTIKIGDATKKTAGTIVAMNIGDVACYLTLKDERGTVFEEMATFEICEKPALLGKRVALSYQLGKVMAAECAGDVTCKKTRTVALVSGARVIETAAGAKPAATQKSFCSASEVVIFSCHTGTRMVSVCASRDAGLNKGYLQYRFGKFDSSEPLEIVLPEGRIAPAKAAIGEVVSFAGGGGTWLRFTKATATYTVYSGIGNWGPKGEKQTKEGLVVERAGKPVASLKCLDLTTSLLGPDWFEKVGIEPGGQDLTFPD